MLTWPGVDPENPERGKGVNGTFGSLVDFMTYFFPHFLCMYFQRDKIVTNQLSHVSVLTVCL